MTSVLSWTWYVVAVSLLLAMGAVVLELALRAYGRAGRWSWALTLPALLAVPIGTLAPQRGALPELPPVALDVIGAPLLLLPQAATETGAALPRFDAVMLLPWLWLAMSLFVLGLVLLSYVALRRAARSWRASELCGAEVLVSARTGPAVVGLRSPRIVVPEWVLELGEAERRLMIVHEQEHMRARDPALLLAGIVVCVLLPWNPVAWWALHRLRVALELDCDARVLARGGDAPAYGALLLEVGRRRSPKLALAAAFAEPRVLERRVRALLRWAAKQRPVLAALCGMAALLFLGAAWAAPQPLAGRAQVAPGLQATSLPMASDTPPSPGKPTFTPSTSPPVLQNRDEVARALVAEYPPLLRDAGIGGTTVTWLFVDENGRVARRLVKTSSGFEALDSAALRVAAVMQFKPAENRGAVVTVWIQIPILFTAKGAAKQVPAPDSTTPPPAAPKQSPTFTPFNTAPQLLNGQEMARALVASYPPLLRDAGIGGTTLVWVYIDESGRVMKTQVKTSSSYTALDEAALRVVTGMRFKPAELKGKPVAVWFEVPIVFSSGPDSGKPGAEEPTRELPRLLASLRVTGAGNAVRYEGALRSGGATVVFAPGTGAVEGPERVLVALAVAYESELRKGVKGGSAQVRMSVGEDGLGSAPELVSSAGDAYLDRLALAGATMVRFRVGAPRSVTMLFEFKPNQD